MREIKFRGKEIDSGKWVYGGLFKEPAPPQCFEKTLKDKYWIVYPDPRYMPDWNLSYKMVRTDVEKDTIGQYTGLKDKNGKEIYEGDIVLYKDWERCYEGGGNDSFINKGVVEYSESNCCFNVTERETIDIEDVLYEGNEDLEVIGNIYDNPELLKKGE